MLVFALSKFYAEEGGRVSWSARSTERQYRIKNV